MNLPGYRQHLLLYGPEMLVETARQDPEMIGHIAELEGAIVKWHRRYEIEDGKRHHRRDPITKKPVKREDVVICACGCGKKVPEDRVHSKGRNAIYFNNACKQRAYRQRKDKQPTSGPVWRLTKKGEFY